VLSWQPPAEGYLSDGGFESTPSASQESTISYVAEDTSTQVAALDQDSVENTATYQAADSADHATPVHPTSASSQLPAVPILDVNSPFYVPPGPSQNAQPRIQRCTSNHEPGHRNEAPTLSITLPTPADVVRAGQKRPREDDEDGADDALGEMYETREARDRDADLVRKRRQEMADMLGFTPTDS
jgi:hypothetical protein